MRQPASNKQKTTRCFLLDTKRMFQKAALPVLLCLHSICCGHEWIFSNSAWEEWKRHACTTNPVTCAAVERWIFV